MVKEGKLKPTDSTIRGDMGHYKVSDDPYDVAVELGKKYKWSQKEIEKAEKLIRKKYIKDGVNEVEVGDKVKINKSYGGGKGKVTNKIGSFVVVNNKSYHETDVKVIAEKFTERGVPFPITEPPKEAYSEFKKWASKNEKSIKKDLIKYTGDASKLFKRMQYWWEKWSNSDAKKEWSNIKGIKFGRSLMVMMKKDNIIISKSGNKLTNLKEANVSWTTLHRDNAKNNLLRQTKLSSKEYQKAKKLKGFNKGNYKWNGDLYVKTIKESSKRDPESIKKEYKDLKKQSISFLRKEWSRSNKVGNPKSLDKEGLLSDILRDRHGNKYVDKAFEGKLTEANKGKVHKAAKKGSYPAVIVVVQDGKVIHQEPVSTPEVAPATFNVMQKKYPKALLHLEDKTGKRLFSELVVTEAAYANATRNELAQYIINLSNELKYAKANKDKKEIKYLEKDIALVKAALKKIKNESVNEAKFAGWIAGYNGKRLEIKKGEAKDLYNAKLLAIKKLKVPKSKVGLMFIKPAVDESINESIGSWTGLLDDLIAFGFGNLAVKFKGFDLGKVKDFKKLSNGPSITIRTFNYLLKKGGLKHNHKRNRAELGSKASKYTKGTVELTEGKLKESTAAWEKSLKDMARSKQLSMLSKGEKSKLLKIAQMLKTANEAKLEKEKFTEPEQMRESQTIKLSELKSFIENLWTNIRKKKARGEKPSEPGQKGYPNKQSWDSATNEMKIESINPLRHPKNKH
tara:strand:- start:146 stop:2356 length:2211 start_codon:yes stop_codon:yes gene_type:complete